jgi:DNA-binding response OmpR family regulator
MELALPDVAVRLADEGVPLRAIARATRVSSEDLRAQLLEAKDDGRLVELPRDDWPPGFPRDQRSLQLSRLMVENKDALLLAVQRVFALTPSEAKILLILVQNLALCRARLEIDPAVLAVHIFHMRNRLASYGLVICSIRNYGYQLSLAHRHKAMDIILQRVSAD